MDKIKCLFLMFLVGCAEISMPPPISLPSLCMGEEVCENRKSAKTLADMGYTDAALQILCDDENVKDILEAECSSSISQ